jgi:hypothetical protein
MRHSPEVAAMRHCIEDVVYGMGHPLFNDDVRPIPLWAAQHSIHTTH